MSNENIRKLVDLMKKHGIKQECSVCGSVDFGGELIAPPVVTYYEDGSSYIGSLCEEIICLNFSPAHMEIIH